MTLIEGLLIYLVILATIGLIVKLFQLWKEKKLHWGFK